MTGAEADVNAMVQQMMATYAEDAVQAARTGFKVELDYSAASVERVEEVLGKIAPSIRRGWLRKKLRLGISDEQIDQICKMFGGYIGEVVRREHGGTWQIVKDPIGGENVIALVRGENDWKIFPPSKVYKRLTNGEGDNVWFYYQVVTREETDA